MIRLVVLITVLVLPIVLAYKKVKPGTAVVVLVAVQLLVVFVLLELVGEAHEEFDPYSMLMGYYILSNRILVSAVLILISVLLFLISKRLVKKRTNF